MKLKILFLSLAATVFLGSFAFGDVAIKVLDGNDVEITFTFKDDAATEMNVIGSFDNWTVPGEPMTKNAAGLWEYKLKALVTDEIQYKFYYKGTWIFDFKAPDKKDDGFGGNNGLIVVADLLAGSGKAPGAAAAGTGPAARRKVAFGTATYVESDSGFDTDAGAFAPTASTIVAKSLWKFYGDLVPKMPGFIELTFFDGESAVWESSGVDLDEGLKGLAAGFVFNPVYYLGGARPAIDKFRFGFDATMVSYETGYANSWLPGHTSVLWETVQAETTVAGSGYGAFRLGSSLRQVGDLMLDAAIVPNRSLDGNYGMYAFANAATGGWKGELQYEFRASTASKTDPTQILVDLPRQDVVLGLEYYGDALSVRAQGLLSKYIAGGATESRPIGDKVACELNLGYRDFFDVYGLNLGFLYRGYAAQMLYADNDDVLGEADSQTLYGEGSYRVGHWVTAKLKASLAIPNGSGYSVALTPGAALDFSVPAMRPLTGDLYCKVVLEGASLSLAAAGARLSVGDLVPGLLEGVDLYYGLDSTDATVMFNSLLAEARLAGGLTGQLGLGLRSGSAAANPLGASIGASWILPVPQARTPTVYAQFLYNLDPYDADERCTYDFSDAYAYHPDGGSATSDGTGAVRIGVKWEF